MKKLVAALTLALCAAAWAAGSDGNTQTRSQETQMEQGTGGAGMDGGTRGTDMDGGTGGAGMEEGTGGAGMEEGSRGRQPLPGEQQGGTGGAGMDDDTSGTGGAATDESTRETHSPDE
jgi:hypothetical protein